MTEPLTRAPYPVELYPGCPCYKCDSHTWEAWYRDSGLMQRMTLCPTCGNKRCPGSTDHTRHPVAELDPSGLPHPDNNEERA